jgi:hypothetical protein
MSDPGDPRLWRSRSIEAKTPKALDLAGDVIKQVITLSTTVTVITITFTKEFRPSGATMSSVPNALVWSWVAFGLAIFFGLWTLMTIVSETDKIEAGRESAGVNASNVRFAATVSVMLFLGGLLLTICAGAAMISTPGSIR